MPLRKTIYDYAIELGACSGESIQKAKQYAEGAGCSPQKALKDTMAVTEDQLLALLGRMYRFKTASGLKQIKIDKDLSARFAPDKLARLKMIPCSYDKVFEVAIVNPNNSLAVEDYIKEIIGRAVKVEYTLITETAFNKHLTSMGKGSTIEYELNETEGGETTESNVYDVTDDDISAIVSVVNKIFAQAARMKASDIHIEPLEKRTRVRFRIDGILIEVLTLPKRLHQQIVNRIKTMANMDVNNTLVSQDGRIRLKLDYTELDMRVSAIPTIISEKMVARLLDQNAVDFDIGMMCMQPDVEKKFMNVINKPSGIVLMTGPTGSGKSSSLYAVMVHLNDVSRCIVTLEQPVEYRVEGLIQIPVSENSNLTFERALREVLRQDPDTILVGEIRDVETAKVAVWASNTGHQVFSTLHTNSAASAVMRLVEMGVEPFLVSSTLNAVVNQRLVRRICPECREQYLLPQDSPYRVVLGDGKDEITLHRGKGCDECNGTGYKGRTAIQELLIVDDDIREALSISSSTARIQEIAIKNGMRTIIQDGIQKALAGLTTLDEIHRIIHFDNIKGK